MLFDIPTTLKAIPYSIIKFTNVLGILTYGGAGIITVLFGQNFYPIVYCQLIVEQVKNWVFS